MPRGSGRRILRGRRSIRPGRQLREDQIPDVINKEILYEEESSSDAGDFSADSGDDYDPERDENKNTSTESGSSTEPDEETPPPAPSPPPGVEGPSCDPEFQWKMDSARPQRFPFLGEPGIKTNFISSTSALADLFF
ncbi:hypothetical protein EVAR_28633_1 [Eumeta japonica]|uniref:Uncharacterized protein n=1 Tax=Eumeta variegata TaxID=151549 RepID=A0A4C1XX84_EUMVA|nr:hypothetical protein EVAR_28633_1 [Eumeta japonica]